MIDIYDFIRLQILISSLSHRESLPPSTLHNNVKGQVSIHHVSLIQILFHICINVRHQRRGCNAEIVAFHEIVFWSHIYEHMLQIISYATDNLSNFGSQQVSKNWSLKVLSHVTMELKPHSLFDEVGSLCSRPGFWTSSGILVERLRETPMSRGTSSGRSLPPSFKPTITRCLRSVNFPGIPPVNLQMNSSAGISFGRSLWSWTWL